MNGTTSFQTAKRKPERRRLGWFSRLFRAVFNLAVISAVLVAVTVVGAYFSVVGRLGDDFDSRYPELPENSYVYGADGEVVGEFIGREDRKTVSHYDLGRYLPMAVTALEDRRFEDHVGVDFEGLGRAAYTDIRAGEVEEGGSTITEQLMKNLYVPDEDRYRVSFWRRFVQASLAFSYERSHSKDEIMTSYLNTVYFGNGAYGAEVASERYFGKSAGKLSLPEAATLAAFLHAPSSYTNVEGGDSYERATERRNQALSRMEEQGMISDQQRARAQGTPLTFDPKPKADYSLYEPFLEKVRREARAELGPESFDRGGLRIQTTLDTDMQAGAVESSGEVLYAPGDPSAAVVSIEPQSGAIRAISGKKGNFQLALDARRQPGSSFKPIVLAAALKRNISPESIYLSRELDLGGDGSEYVINNYDYAERGGISLYEALAESDNTVFARLGMYLGMDDVVRTARELGVKSPLEAEAATAIGGAETGVSPLEMASVYATFAGGGVYREPYAVENIARSSFGEDETVYDHDPVGRRVMSGDQAAAATDVMRGVVENGTASRFHDLDRELNKPSAGKTGTTDDYVDAWYVGYTPRLSTAVWVGYPEGNRSMVGVQGLSEAGGETLSLDLWALYMARATEGQPELGFREPDLSRFRVLDRSYYAGSETPDLASGDAETALVPDSRDGGR